MLKKEPMESIRYVDRPDVTETFVDSFRLATYDGRAGLGKLDRCISGEIDL